MMRQSVSGLRSGKQWWFEVAIGVAIVWLGVTALEAMATATHVRVPVVTDTDQVLAEAIVQSERERIGGLPYEDLRPTGGFVAPEWIRQHGLEPGQIAVISQPADESGVEGEQVYDVRWKVENVDQWGSIRRVSISVEWRQSNERVRRIVVTSLRAGSHQA